MKRRIFDILNPAEKGDLASKIFDLFIIFLILLNVFTIIIGTFEIPPIWHNIFWYVEVVSIVIFTIEYLLRLWTCPLFYADKSPAKARIKYCFSFSAIIDLLAILPFYIPFILPIDLRVLRVLRIFRLFRLLKINRYTKAFGTIGSVLKKKSSQLFSSFFVIALLMVITSVLMYNVENPVQPEVFRNAFSGLWWSVATFTTVGYGDIYPISALGQLLSSVIAFLGIGLVAVPTGIISAGFVEQIEEDKKIVHDPRPFCPYCGHSVSEG